MVGGDDCVGGQKVFKGREDLYEGEKPWTILIVTLFIHIYFNMIFVLCEGQGSGGEK